MMYAAPFKFLKLASIFFCCTGCWVWSTFSSYRPLSSNQRCWLSSATLIMFPLKNNQECMESNPGLMGKKQVYYFCAMLLYLFLGCRMCWLYVFNIICPHLRDVPDPTNIEISGLSQNVLISNPYETKNYLYPRLMSGHYIVAYEKEV